MSSRLWIRMIELAVIVIATVSFAAAWRAERTDRAQLAAELATAKRALSEADAHQHDRDAQLLQTLSAIALEKRSVTTPAQVIRDLPEQIPLPQPIALEPTPEPASEPGNTSRAPNAAQHAAEPAHALIPVEDLKPLYDYSLDCNACRARLATTQSDLDDEKTKTSLLTKERDAAVRTAKGGSALQRIARAAKWLAIGVAIGAATARAHR